MAVPNTVTSMADQISNLAERVSHAAHELSERRAEYQKALEDLERADRNYSQMTGELGKLIVSMQQSGPSYPPSPTPLGRSKEAYLTDEAPSDCEGLNGRKWGH